MQIEAQSAPVEEKDAGVEMMDEKKESIPEISTVTVTMSRPVAEAVAAACEMYLRLHMGQFNDLAEDLCMCKHYANRNAGKFRNEKEADRDFRRALRNRNSMVEEMDRLYYQFGCRPPISDGMCIPYRAEQVWLAIRYALAWHDKPEGDKWSVCFDRPLNRSDQPQPEIKLVEKPREMKWAFEPPPEVEPNV